ncbi:polyhydroxyalkanoate synthesis regulator DNA-binding domain-containing protein [Cystobacter fuscus]
MPAKEPKVIKRYTNRKLYDTVESRYVTLDEIAAMIKEGVEVQIVDNKTKEDLTSVTLAQIIFEEEKKRNRMPLTVLREIIRHPGESLTDFIQKAVTPRVASIREEAESRLDKLLRREEATPGDEPAAPRRTPAAPRRPRPAERRSCSRPASARSRTGSAGSTSGSSRPWRTWPATCPRWAATCRCSPSGSRSSRRSWMRWTRRSSPESWRG